MRLTHLAYFAPLAATVQAAYAPSRDVASYIDPFIGTLGPGHVFSGPSTPFGSIKPGLDSDTPGNQAGFVPDGKSRIFGISALHDDGTGGRPSLGMSSLLPQYCQLNTEESDSSCKWTRYERRAALVNASAGVEWGRLKSAPGEFSASLSTGIDVAFAAAGRSAVFEFDFTEAIRRGSWGEGLGRRADNIDPVLVYDYTTDLQGSGRAPPNSLRISSAASGMTRIETSATFLPSFGVGNFTVYTCLDVPLVRSFGTYQGSMSTPGITKLTNTYGEAGAILTLNQDALSSSPYNGVLPARMGISWVSTAAACRFATEEIPSFPLPSALSQVAAQTRAKWNTLLGSSLSISHTGLSEETLTLFYTSLYRTFLSPNNVTGDNPRWSSSKPSFDSLYCIWDSARTIHPLWALLAPQAQGEVVEAIVEVQKQEGWLPDCRMSTNQGYTQGGSNAEMLLSDSFLKSIHHNNTQLWEDALQAMLKDAQIEPPSWGLVGRGGIAARAALGYVPRGKWGNPETVGATPGRTASRTIEYAYNDFSIALVAAGLKSRGLYERYKRASNDTLNLWNTSTTSDGFSGFLQAREVDGSWAYQDPKRCSPALEPNGCFLDRGEGKDFYEASSWQYSFFAPHDMATIVSLMGGSTTFLKRYLHMWAHEYADISDEPGFLAAYSAHYAPGGYSHTVDTVLSQFRSRFGVGKGGLPGNDDVGAMGSFIVWVHLGMFPVAGTGVYLLSTPLVEGYEIRSGVTGEVFRLKTRGWDGAKRNKYIVEAWLDGRRWTKNWLCHTVFTEGSTLELVLGDEPSEEFGGREEDLPPSLSTGGFAYDSPVLGC